jgi:hypothetical protein
MFIFLPNKDKVYKFSEVLQADGLILCFTLLVMYAAVQKLKSHHKNTLTIFSFEKKSLNQS